MRNEQQCLSCFRLACIFSNCSLRRGSEDNLQISGNKYASLSNLFQCKVLHSREEWFVVNCTEKLPVLLSSDFLVRANCRSRQCF